MRLIHAVRDLAAETGEPIETVALYTDVDRTATFVREADIAYDLGPAAERPYLNLDLLGQALTETGADAAWVGWGFVAEDPAFAEKCAEVGVTFVGPSPEAMRQLGDKIGAKLIAEEVGVPVAPWSRGPVETLDEAKAKAVEIGYPLMLKATAGGGGRGIRKVTSAAELEDAYLRTREEAERAFGSGVVFLERLVTGARHVEVQVIADGQGTAWALGVRDCSVQRRNQKVIEESASPVLGDEQVRRLKESAERLAVKVGYRGAATVEFLYHPGDDLLAFLEVNTRLQVEHPITEVTNNFDLVRAQLFVAAGNKLEGEPPTERGHAIEARLNAEDPDRDFAPAPGRIALLNLPAGPGIRIDTGVSAGDTIPADFDSMIAKIIAFGSTRDEALGRLRRAVSETRVIIEGGATNKSFVLDLLDQPEVIDGSADTGWIDRVRGEGRLVADRHTAVALASAAIDAYEDAERTELARLLTTASGGRPQVQHESGTPLDFKLRGATYRVRVARTGGDRFRLVIENGDEIRTADVDLERFDHHTGQAVVNGVTYRLTTDTHGPIHVVDVDGTTHRVSRDEGGVVRSPAPALVVAVPIEVGSEVEAGAPILVLESMKMETVLRAPFTARVKECAVTVGSQVEAGAPLLRLELIGDGSEAKSAVAETVPLDLPEVTARRGAVERAEAGRSALRSLLLGFDVDPADESRLLDEYLVDRAAAEAEGVVAAAAELDLAGVFADLAELGLRRGVAGDDEVHSPREHFHTYLRTLDADQAGLPQSYREKLSAALGRYDVTELDRTTDLEGAVFRIFLAQQRPKAGIRVITALLRNWLRESAPPVAEGQDARATLDRLIGATQSRYPVIADLARGVVFAWFGQPLLHRNRANVYSAVRETLRHLDENPSAPDRADRISQMVRSTEPLVLLLGERLVAGSPHDNSVMLEVLTRRYYGNKGLSDVRTQQVDGSTFVAAEKDGATLASTAVSFEQLGEAVAGLAAVAEGASSVDADIYLSWEQQPDDDQDELATRLHDVLARHPLAPQVRRVTLTVAGSGGAVMHHHFTFRPDSAGVVVEDRLIRGLHPYIAERMQLERLHRFSLNRLTSSDDEEVYLYRAVAKDNPADDRLVAFAQVRDLAAVRDGEGRMLALPTAEIALDTCVDSIRRAQAGRPSAKRLPTNRIVMYVWPPVELSDPELDALAGHIESTTVAAGLEEVLLIGRRRDPETGALTKTEVRVSFSPNGRAEMHVGEPAEESVEPIDGYRQKVLRAASRNTAYPYELTGALGDFVEYDLADTGQDDTGRVDGADVLVPVDRPRGGNSAGIVVGVISTPTDDHPEGIKRVLLLGDPTKSLGALAEAECRRIIAAIDLADELQVPVEWYALSAGARISMDSGTENMDWVAGALKRIVEFTQDGGEINIVSAGINVGAQPYWNAEATMLMHTKGVLIMTPESAMVLTGKQSLDFSGGVSAEDNFGIGGYDRIMGPNGQAQYWAPDLLGAHKLLMQHYAHTYIAPGEDAPRRTATADPIDRDITEYPHELADSDFTTVGDIFSSTKNPDRKKPFDIRTVMRALSDQDHEVLERWATMADAETAVVQDVHLGGIPVCLLGIESKSVPRLGFRATDGPDTYTAGTLFPQSSKKAARAINGASGNRPLVVLANLSGFDGSPESLRKLQLEYGAEIGRAIVNFDGPIVFCVISRYHGGAFVVFSKQLNPNMTVLAIEGSFASVLGGAPAAAVVFAGEVNARTDADKRVRMREQRLAEASGSERAAMVAELDEARSSVRAEKLGEVAAEFDAVHSIRRAVEVGSVDEIVAAVDLRPKIIAVLEAAGAGQVGTGGADQAAG